MTSCDSNIIRHTSIIQIVIFSDLWRVGCHDNDINDDGNNNNVDDDDDNDDGEVS